MGTFMLARFPQLKRVATTVATVAAGFGFIFALEAGVRALMRDGAEVRARAELPKDAARFMAKTYDLGLIVPPKLRFTVGGLEARRELVTLEVPRAQAERESDDQARAAGWRPYDPLAPLADSTEDAAVEARTVLRKSGILQTPEGRLVMRSFRDVPGGTEREEFEIDVSRVRNVQETAELNDVIARNSEWIEREVPPLLMPIVWGGVIYSQLVSRGGGHSYFALMLRRAPVETARGEQSRMLVAAGWVRQRRMSEAWAKENLLAIFSYEFNAEAGGTMVTARISDDELVERPGRPDPSGVM